MRSCNWAVGGFLVFSLVSWWAISCLQSLLMDSLSLGIVVKLQETMNEKRLSSSSLRTIVWWSTDELPTETEFHNEKRGQKTKIHVEPSSERGSLLYFTKPPAPHGSPPGSSSTSAIVGSASQRRRNYLHVSHNIVDH